MKARLFFLLGLCIVLSALALSSCASSGVATSVDSSINFAAYRTFAWLPDSTWQETKYDNAILQRRVEQEVVQLLKIKGYTLDTLQADFLVHHHVTVEERKRVVQAPSYLYSPNRYFANRGYFLSMYEPMMVSNRFREVQYREGILIVDVVDRKQQRLVWRGWSEQPIESIAEFERSVESRVKEIIAQFPAPGTTK
jgi:hypothetical protein